MASITTRAGKGSPLTNNEVDANFTNLNDDKQEILAEGAFVDGDKNKLDGIESGADVTDTANVTAAGALMDSEVTNLAAVKSFDPADYATSAQGDLADSALQAETNDLTSAVTWANVPDANITQSSVTQHQAALSIANTQVTGLGTASTQDVGTSAGDVVQLDGTGALPAVDGSNLTNVSSVATLNDLTDVDTTGVTDGQVIAFNNATSQWEAETVQNISLVFPFFDSTGTSDTISLISNQDLPFFKADGTENNISVVSQ